MVDMDQVIACNINKYLKKLSKNSSDLAIELGVDLQDVRKMLAGTRVINVIELEKIAKICNTSFDELLKPDSAISYDNASPVFLGAVATQEAQDTLKIAGQIIDLYIFHNKVYNDNLEFENKKSRIF